MAERLPAAARLLQDGRIGEAVAVLRDATLAEPGNAALHHDLGLACLEMGLLEEAAEALRACVAINPRYADAWFRLGLACERMGEPAVAVAAFERATTLLPSLSEAWFRAGSQVFAMGHKEAAIGCFRRAAAGGRRSTYARLGEARALLAEERDAEAERVLRHMLALHREHPIALDLLGNLLADSGRFEEARDCFARAIAVEPFMAGSYYDLVRCRRVLPEERALPARMEALLAAEELNPLQRLRVLLALGKAWDDLDEPARAMAAFDAAGELRRHHVPWDAAAFDAQIDAFIAHFTPELMAQAGDIGNADQRTPLLIVGLPRSGTTLVEQIVSSHHQVAGGGELNFWNERGADWQKAGVDAAFLRAAAAQYRAVLHSIGPKAARVTDKMPFNILWAGMIYLACPGAVIIHCVRSDIDTALSIHQTHFNPNLAFPTGGDDLVAYIRSVRRLAAHWRRVLPPRRFVEMRYESLVAAPQDEIPRLIAACGLDWDAACLAPERNTRVVKTPSRWQARQAIHGGAVQRWRRYETCLGPLAALLEQGLLEQGLLTRG